ncbi:ABC transporter substrate-binding protein [Bifidobacterium sp.]|jgi:raffinose/stachyose/melibiose transport system substrate-binding protein|uniref:ABC transporter substrate-binding protein n=2 Tax=Bifidobacterium sp. TaxID=41200 RepID=UPI0025B82969|nr:ABC transporter substrate-binding protein [Bifidobacterium sp.]MCI1224871.1 ABC transporter substrate-binding protein [Bifidobacterium sp.]
MVPQVLFNKGEVIAMKLFSGTRKIACAAVAVLTTLGLAACGSAGSSGKVTKITFFDSKVEIVDSLKALAKEYQKETGVTVEVWGTTGDDYITQLKTKLANKTTGPSIYTTGGGQEGDTLKSYMADLSGAPFVKNIAEGKAYELDGKTLGMPAAVEGYGLIVNTSLVDPATVTTQDGFISMLKQAKADGKYTGFELSQESYFLIGHMLNTAFALQSDPKQFVADVVSGKAKLQDTKEFQDLGQIYEAIRDNTNNPLQINYDKQIGDLMTGKTASVNQGMWINTMLSSYEDSSAKLQMLPFPLADNSKLAVDVPLYYHVNSSKSSAEQKASIDFLNWMVTSKTGQDYIVNKFKFIPAMTNIKVDESKMDVLAKAVYDASQSGDNIPWAYQYWPTGIADTYLVGTAQEFFTNKSMTGTQFITKLNDDFVAAGTKK